MCAAGSFSGCSTFGVRSARAGPDRRAVVNSASISGVRGSGNLSGYVASKHAVVGLTRTAALEVAAKGVRVDVVCPSGVEGRMIQSLADMTPSLPYSASRRGFAERKPHEATRYGRRDRECRRVPRE